MAEDKKDMPVDGSGTDRKMADENGELASRRDADMPGYGSNPGESGGGPYPNPYSGKDGSSDGPDTFGGHGGQGKQGYYGKGQLGDKDVGKTDNAPSKAE
ncbi:MAG TPA: hypothetical protein VD768_05560 [Sphingomicrobium sp.]|nr:hypothetical protein [Sphingomicrobium sp.]